MIVKLNTYEGVPIGGNNFGDFLEYVRKFLGANFGFSTNVLDNQGGYFSDDAFAYNSGLGAGGVTYEGVFFGPSIKDVGSLFGRKDGEYYRFEVLSTSPAPQAYKWTTLLTDGIATSLDRLVFENVDENTDRQLPYRPVFFSESLNAYDYGFYDVRINGVPQSLSTADVAYSYLYSPPSFSAQTFALDELTLGAEHPLPIFDGRYDDSFLDPLTGVNRQTLNTSYNNTLRLEYTNFSLDFGAHILLWRAGVGGVNRFVYMPQDLSSSVDVAPGTFKVLDFSTGEIKLNITSSQLQSLLFEGETVGDVNTDISFVVVSAEQLKEEFIGGIGHYYTRYGKVYNGESTGALLAEYIFDGTQNLVREIPQTDYFSGVGNLLLQDTNRRYDDGVILGIRYKAVPSSTELAAVQKNRYKPDTIQFYYNVGIVKQNTVANTSIRSMVETNPSSWYNRDVLDAEYFPVNRVDEAYHTFLHELEAPLFGDVFDPNLSFQIVDTIGLQDLNDVVTPGNNQVLIFNGTTFVGINYTLAALLDTNFTGVSELDLIQRSGGAWINRNLSTVLSSAQISSQIEYTSGISAGLGSAPSTALVSKGYVDSLAGGTSGDITSHINATDVHGATSGFTFASNAGANRLIIRDNSGVAQVARSAAPLVPSNLFETPPTDIVNIHWIRNVANNEAVGNTLVRRDINGKFKSGATSGSDVSNTVTTKGYVDSLVGSSGIAQATNSGNPGYIRLGEFVLAWSTVKGSSSTTPLRFDGPSLPSGTRTFLTTWVTAATTNSAVMAALDQGGGPGGINCGISGSTPYTYVVGSARAGSGYAYSARVFWVIRVQ